MVDCPLQDNISEKVGIDFQRSFEQLELILLGIKAKLHYNDELAFIHCPKNMQNAHNMELTCMMNQEDIVKKEGMILFCSKDIVKQLSQFLKHCQLDWWQWIQVLVELKTSSKTHRRRVTKKSRVHGGLREDDYVPGRWQKFSKEFGIIKKLLSCAYFWENLCT